MRNDNADEIKKAKREYHRAWRKNNPERVAEIMERFWRKKVTELRNRDTDPGQDETGADE